MSKKQAKGETIKEQIVLTSELAAVIGKTPQWVRELTRDGVLKQISRGKYNLTESVQAYIKHVQNDGQDSDKPKYRDAKTEHELIKKEKSELELRALKGQLHEAKDVRRIMGDMIITAKARLQAIPMRIAPRLEDEPAVKIESELTKEISEALRALADYSPSMFEKDEQDD